MGDRSNGPLITCPRCGTYLPLAAGIGAAIDDMIWRCPNGHAFGPGAA